MATSGNVSFNYTTNQIITKALRLLGVIGQLESAAGEDYGTCLDTLNMMIKHWEGQGIYVSTETFGEVFLNVGQQYYALGGSSADKASTDPTIETQLSVLAATSANSLTVNSTTGMNMNDQIGIVLDANTIYWSTISSVGSSTVVNIAGTLPSNASIGAYVFTYTTQIGRPLEIRTVLIRKSGGTDSTLATSTVEYKLLPLSRSNYMAVPNKMIQGTPVQYYVDKQNSQTNLYVYPTCSTPQWRLRISYKRIFQDFTNPNDNPDLPQEWIATIAYNLAVWVNTEYGKELKVALSTAQGANLRDQAAKMLNEMLSNSQEKSRFKFASKVGYNI